MLDTTPDILALISDDEARQRMELFLRNPNRQSLHPSDIEQLDRAIITAHRASALPDATEVHEYLKQDARWSESSAERVYNHINVGKLILDLQRRM